MLNVYVISVYHDIMSHVEPIKRIKPDRIIGWSDAEYDADFIFKNFIDELTPWLKENNKTLDIISAGPNIKINDNVYCRSSFGYYLINKYMTVLKHSRMNFDDVHTKANKLYTLYCNRGSYARQTIIDTFAREKLIDQGVVTFRGNYYTELPWKYHDGSPLIDEEDFVYGVPNTMLDPTQFPKSFFTGFVDVVCESREEPKEFFMTEKTAKSIVALKPFVALSCQHYHKHLQEEYGIEPYTEIFDYSFDSCVDINDRIEGIVHNVKSLADKDKNVIHDLVFDKMVRNKQRYNEYGSKYDKMVPETLKFAFESEFALHGDTFAMDAWLNLIKQNNWTAE